MRSHWPRQRPSTAARGGPNSHHHLPPPLPPAAPPSPTTPPRPRLAAPRARRHQSRRSRHEPRLRRWPRPPRLAVRRARWGWPASLQSQLAQQPQPSPHPRPCPGHAPGTTRGDARPGPGGWRRGRRWWPVERGVEGLALSRTQRPFFLPFPSLALTSLHLFDTIRAAARLHSSSARTAAVVASASATAPSSPSFHPTTSSA